MVNKRVRNAVLGCSLKNERMISVQFQGKPFNIMVIQAYAPSSNTEEAKVEWFQEDLQDLLELTSKKDVLFIIGDQNAKVGSQEIPGVIGKYGLGVQNGAGQKLTEFCQRRQQYRLASMAAWISSTGFPTTVSSLTHPLICLHPQLETVHPALKWCDLTVTFNRKVS